MNFKNSIIIAMAILAFAAASAETPNYQNNRYPLKPKPYIALPIGTIKAKGWLQEMLERQKSGATGQMDKLYPSVMGARNGWLGGDGDQWERGPYWIDGLLPLAYLLDDQTLKDKAQPWVEWALKSQREDGFFGPSKNYDPEPGLQRNNAEDWWPRMVVLKILQQYYSATQDERIIAFLTKYFRYQLKTLPTTPLGKWTFWAEYRVCDNLQVVYWLYNITGDAFLLELGDLLHRQSIDYVSLFMDGKLANLGAIHCVNLAQGIKEPVIYYQQHPDSIYIKAVKKGFADIRKYNGHAQGMYGGDEDLHGNVATQGSELCSAVELMYSLENMLEITGDLSFADHLEKVAFNALPTQISDDFMTKQYFQQANQVAITRGKRNFNTDHNGTDVCFGLLTGYPCCASNMHQGWPKFTQNLWYATPDNGLAAVVFSPSEVTAKVADGVAVKVTEDTYYPMDDKISFAVSVIDRSEVAFPLHLRIPSWCKKATILVNGVGEQTVEGNQVAVIKRTWKSGDKVELQLPMEVSIVGGWEENAVSVERGPLVYGLKMREQWKLKKFPKEEVTRFGESYYEVTSPDKWNYGLVNFDRAKTAENVKVTVNADKQKSNYPWNLENAPIEIRMQARQIPSWTLYNNSAGPLQYSVGYLEGSKDTPSEEIVLIPYGCTTLRISEFPVVR